MIDDQISPISPLSYCDQLDFSLYPRNWVNSIEPEVDQFFNDQTPSNSTLFHSQIILNHQSQLTFKDQGRVLRVRQPTKKINTHLVSQGNGRKRKLRKPSPFHNYQRHLVIALKHMIQPPQASFFESQIIQIERLLWKAFIDNQNLSKKALYFIFNQQNEYQVKDDQISLFGFQQIYRNFPVEQISLAKCLMTERAIQQLTEDAINRYISTTRIRNRQKFKNYLGFFMKQLEEGYIRKRLSVKQKVLKSGIINNQ